MANRRFVSFYFDLSDRGAAGDPDARTFVVAARKELGGSGVPTPPLLFMAADGKVLGEVSNYASSEQVIATMQKVLQDHPEYNVASEQERVEQDMIVRAEIHIDLQQYDDARKVLTGVESRQAHYLLGRLARFAKDWEEMEGHFDNVTDEALADDVRIEKAYRHWSAGEFGDLLESVEDFPKESNRYTEASYYKGLALYHLKKQDEALDVWKTAITGCSQDRWIYRSDWAYSTIKQGGGRGFFSTAGPRHSLLNRIGYMGRKNPDLEPQK